MRKEKSKHIDQLMKGLNIYINQKRLLWMMKINITFLREITYL